MLVKIARRRVKRAVNVVDVKAHVKQGARRTFNAIILRVVMRRVKEAINVVIVKNHFKHVEEANQFLIHNFL